jgi:hypothetical protein
MSQIHEKILRFKRSGPVTSEEPGSPFMDSGVHSGAGSRTYWMVGWRVALRCNKTQGYDLAGTLQDIADGL